MRALLARSVGPDIPVDRRSILIGRHPGCDALLNSPRVSRRHCIITSEGGEAVIRDLGSTNGTWINGRRVAAGRIRPGDEVAIAHMRYYLGEAPTRCTARAGLPSHPESTSYSPKSSDVPE